MNPRLGCLPDRHDTRDYPFAALAPAAPLPAKLDLRPWYPPVMDQGDLGSCTANALCGGREFLEIRDGNPLTPLSRLALYYGERRRENTTADDAGAMIRDGLRELRNRGCPPESLWPYDITRFRDAPPPNLLLAGHHFKIERFHRCASVEDVKRALVERWAIPFGVPVFDSFLSPETARTGVIPMPQSGEKMEGGHAIGCVGYDDSESGFIIRNSWGATWGQGGYALLPYGYMEEFETDMWAFNA